MVNARSAPREAQPATQRTSIYSAAGRGSPGCSRQWVGGVFDGVGVIARDGLAGGAVAAGTASVGNVVVGADAARGVGVGVGWRTAVDTTVATMRARPGVGVATLAAGGSGFDVSRLRGFASVGVTRGTAGAAGATGATTGAAGSWRGTAGGSAMTGTLNGVGVGGTEVGATAVGESAGAPVTVASASLGVKTAVALAVGASVGSGSAASAASSSISTRRSTIVLPSPSR